METHDRMLFQNESLGNFDERLRQLNMQRKMSWGETHRALQFFLLIFFQRKNEVNEAWTNVL